MIGASQNLDSGPLDPGFKDLSEIAYAEAGLILSAEKATMIKSRLRHRLKELGIKDLLEYCSYVRSDCGTNEMRNMISALTTNVSNFFREPHHFEQIVEELAPQMIKQLKLGQQVRIWSAGCSTGQEPYSIAMSLANVDSIFLKENFKILATDIDPQVISHAKSGCYDESKLATVPLEMRSRYFEQLPSEKSRSEFRVSAAIRDRVTFKELNLIQPWPMRRKFSAIFCRNVVIYFDSQTQKTLWPRFRKSLNHDGLMFVGHSERITDPDFESVGATAYRISEVSLKKSNKEKDNRYGA